MKAPSLQFDTRDDRRELHILLGCLPPLQRVAFLAECCRAAVVPHSRVQPFVDPKTYEQARSALRDDVADARLSLAVFYDLWMLAVDYAFDLDGALKRLEQIARRAGRR